MSSYSAGSFHSQDKQEQLLQQSKTISAFIPTRKYCLMIDYTTSSSDQAIWLINKKFRMCSNQHDSTPDSLLKI